MKKKKSQMRTKLTKKVSINKYQDSDQKIAILFAFDFVFRHLRAVAPVPDREECELG